MVEELRQEMQKLANYKAAQQKLAGMETLGDEPKRAQASEKKGTPGLAKGGRTRAWKCRMALEDNKSHQF